MPIVKYLLPYNYLSSSSRALRYQLNTLHRSTSTVMIAINSLTAILDNDDDDEEEEDDMIRHVLQRYSLVEKTLIIFLLLLLQIPIIIIILLSPSYTYV